MLCERQFIPVRQWACIRKFRRTPLEYFEDRAFSDFGITIDTPNTRNERQVWVAKASKNPSRIGVGIDPLQKFTPSFGARRRWIRTGLVFALCQKHPLR